MTNFDLECHDKKLRGTIWDTASPVAVVCLCHGFGEHIGRYIEFAKRMNRSELVVMGVDLAGHGLSEGKRGDIDSFGEYIDDLEQLVLLAKQKYSSLPIILYGQSLGGNIVANFLLSRNQEIKAGIISSPWLRLALKPSAFTLYLAKMLKKLGIVITQRAPLKVEDLSRDLEIGKAYAADPLVHDNITSRAFFEIVSAGEDAIMKAHTLSVNTLASHGTDDHITSFEATEEWCKNAGPLAKFVPWENHRHESHFELNKEEVLDFNISWILDQL